jgi:hypothetical protein
MIRGRAGPLHVGTLSVLLIQYDLVKHGIAASPTHSAAGIDLAACPPRGGVVFKIEVPQD